MVWFLGKVFIPMQSWPTWLVVSTVQGNHSPYLHTGKDLPCQIVLLQLRLYVLYNRSNKILGFMTIFFLAEMATQVYIYVNFGAIAKGWPEAFTIHSLSATSDHF